MRLSDWLGTSSGGGVLPSYPQLLAGSEGQLSEDSSCVEGAKGATPATDSVGVPSPHRAQALLPGRRSLRLAEKQVPRRLLEAGNFPRPYLWATCLFKTSSAS